MTRGTRRSQNNPQKMTSASHDTMNLIPELRSTISKKIHKNGTMTKFCKQGRCRMCYKGRPTTRGPHQNLSDFLYSGNTNENQWILFYFQFYALEQSSWMLLKFFFSEIIFWLKYLCFLDTPICVFFSNLGQFLEIKYFLTQYYNRKDEKICTSAIPPISKESHECGKLSWV